MSSRYCVDYTEQAAKSIEDLGYFDSRLVLSWIDKNLNGCDSPQVFGHALADKQAHATLCGLKLLDENSEAWCYHVGEYHLIAEIRSDLRQILILALRQNGAANSDDAAK